MKNTLTKATLFMAAMAFAIVSCKKDDNEDDHDHDDHNHEEELITTVQIRLTDGQNSTVYNWRDLDGPGGDDPVIESIELDADGVYSYTLSFLNESEDPAEDITAEINEEADEHLVCFESANLTVTRMDKDSQDREVGLVGTVEVSENVDGSLNIELRHQPGVKDGSCTVGSSDIDVTFPVTIK